MVVRCRFAHRLSFSYKVRSASEKGGAAVKLLFGGGLDDKMIGHVGWLIFFVALSLNEPEWNASFF